MDKLARKMVFPSITCTGSVRSLKLKFRNITPYNRGKIHFGYVVQVLKQVCKQCEKQIPTFIMEPVRKATEELDIIFRERSKVLVMTQRKNLIVIHANKIVTFGNRYTLEKNPVNSSIGVTITGSDILHDMFIYVCESGDLVMSYKGQAKKVPEGKESVVEL